MTSAQPLLLPPLLLPPVSWLALALRPGAAWATGGRFVHQSPLHRAMLVTSAGPRLVSVPIRHVRDAQGHIPFLQAQPATDHPWARTLTRTLATAYRRAAYWPHYGPGLLACFQPYVSPAADAAPPPLAALSRRLLEWLLAPLEAPLPPVVAAPPALTWPAAGAPSWFRPQPYFQCFGGFVADASALDLLLNLGPAARRVLIDAVDEAALAQFIEL